MNKNLFQELKQKREAVKDFAKKALEKSWIDENSYQEIEKKIENDTLTIGVIGQMKAGKSTFLNAFLFGEEILPAATTPMTAALSVITYGEQKTIEVEFYTQDEWLEMKTNASRSLEDVVGDKFLESKIKAAKELVEKSGKIGEELTSILGTTRKDTLDNLIEYVGADGKYVSITKSVTIYYPEDWLKGVRVVDTPGFNDPVVSREERTQEFLKEADAVLLLVYAGRAFDATDREILFEKVRKVGIGKVLIGINKYDIQYNQGESIEEITQNVKDEVKKACRDQGDETINGMLLNIEPIPFSANMALMAKTPLQKVLCDENSKFYWDKACDDFEISSQKEMFDKSLISNLENSIKQTIEKSKAEILLKKPVNTILQSGTNKLNIVNDILNKSSIEKENLLESDEKWAEKAKEIERASKRIERILSNGSYDLNSQLKKDLTEVERKLIDDIIKGFKKMQNIINDANRFTGEGRALRNLDNNLEDLINNLNYIIKDYELEIKDNVIDCGNKIVLEIEDILRKYIKADYEEILQDFITTIRDNEYLNNLKDDNLENYYEQNNYTFWDGVEDFSKIIWNTLFLDKISASWKRDFYEMINEYKRIIEKNVQNQIKDLEIKQNYYLKSLNEEGAKQILPNIIEMRNQYKGKEKEKQSRIKELEDKILSSKKEKEIISQELEDMKRISLSII